MRYLILGAKGQIGSALSDYHARKGDIVDDFDIVNSEEEDLRINNNGLLLDCIKKADFVYFLAFDVGGSRYLKKQEKTFEFIENNMKIMVNTFKALKDSSKPFIFASTQMSEMSFSTYGILKKIGEHYTNSLNGLYVKFWNVYGLENNLNKSHVITDFINKAIKYNKIEMITDGSEMRQFLHTDDCCECLNTLSSKYFELDRAKNYHISSFTWSTILEVAKEVALNFNNVEIVPNASKDSVQRDKKYEPDSYILNLWQPKIPLKEGIQKMITSM